MQEGSEELGAGHEDAVGQQEVTEECLCWAGLGWEGTSEAVIAQLYEQLEHTPPPQVRHKQGDQCPAPVTVFSTPTKGTSCQLPTWTNPAPDEVRPQ